MLLLEYCYKALKYRLHLVINEHETITMEQVRAAVNSDNYHYRIKGLHTRNFESRVHQMLCDAVYATLL